VNCRSDAAQLPQRAHQSNLKTLQNFSKKKHAIKRNNQPYFSILHLRYARQFWHEINSWERTNIPIDGAAVKEQHAWWNVQMTAGTGEQKK
jgi:hypothetical protein